MMTGTVTADREILLSLNLLAADGSNVSVQAMLDTGFNGFLTLPPSLLQLMTARLIGTRRAELGDGRITEFRAFMVTVVWHDGPREVLAIASETTPVVGMSLLWGSRVAFDAQEDGAVTVEDTGK